MAEKAKALGVMPGPLFGRLKAGESVTLENGAVITPREVTDGLWMGRVVTVLGDTSPCEMALALSEHADVLVHEATFAAGLEEKAHEFGHCTTTEAAYAAREAGVRQLVMTHFSGRYSNEELARLEAEAAAVFPNVMAATDLRQLEIQRAHLASKN
jgi:ribonuclease Z